MSKRYLSGRVKRTPQDQLKDNERYLGLDQAEPNLSDPIYSTGVPAGQQYQLVAIPGFEGKRYWVPVYRVNSKGLIRGAVEEFKTINNYILVIAPEGGVEPVKQFRSGFYYLAKGLNIPYVPIEIDFKNRCFAIQEPKYITGTFEQESEKIASLFSVGHR